MDQIGGFRNVVTKIKNATKSGEEYYI